MAQYLKTNLEGKVKNMPHFHSEALLPLFEAVVNSIQAIQEKKQPRKSDKIIITINRSRTDQQKMSFASDEKIIGFTIEDTGVGFNDTNFESFQTADTVHKIEKGCKGVGRFFWLKAFDKVEIESVFQKGDSDFKRVIDFTLSEGIETTEPVAVNSPRKTIVRLMGFKEEYRKLQSAYKTTKKIAQRILEHCLSYFITGFTTTVPSNY